MVVYLVTFASIPFGGIPGDLCIYLMLMVYLATLESTLFVVYLAIFVFIHL